MPAATHQGHAPKAAARVTAPGACVLDAIKKPRLTARLSLAEVSWGQEGLGSTPSLAASELVVQAFSFPPRLALQVTLRDQLLHLFFRLL